MRNQNFNEMYGRNFMSSNGGSDAVSFTDKVSAVMKRVYGKMFFGMLVTAVVSWLLMRSSGFIPYYMTHSWLMWGVAIAEFALVIGLQAGINKMSSAMCTLLFYVFAALNGLMLTPIFAIYTGVSIAKTFFITAGLFGAMSVYGFFTSSDLTSIGKYLMYALFGIIICIIVNIFWANSTFDWIISFLGVLVFVGLTAWDTQQVKQMAQTAPGDSVAKLATIGALTLYLDFINMFLFLLRLFGNNNN